MTKLSKLLSAGALIAALATTPAQALTINLINTGGVGAGTDALRGFTAAKNFWERVLTNNVTVTLNVGFGALGPNILGSTSSTTNVAYVGQVFPALQSTGSGRLDAIANANLPNTRASGFIGGQAIDALISAPKANGNGVQQPITRVLDADASANNSAFSANTSLMKALGLAVTYAPTNTVQADGTVTFSNAYNWDFNPENGINSDQIDFVGVAIHEIGHALGFRSGVDSYDVNRDFNGNLNGFAIMTIWDTFRYSAASTALGVNDWAIGGSTLADAPYFSIDGGATVFTSGSGEGFLSTGRNLGDGRQASHWKDRPTGQPQLGALDPTVAFGQQTIVTSLDLAAYDAMGWNIAYDVIKGANREFSSGVAGSAFAVPEPAIWAQLIAGFGILGGALRRLRRRGGKLAIA